MHPLREAMLDQMHLRGHSPRTQQSYVNAVSLLSRHYHRSPDRLSQDELQSWILHLVKERQLSAATCRLYLNAIRFFYLQVLGWSSCQLELTTPKRPQRIPYLLSPSEVRRIIEHADNPKYAMMFALCYACGLRVSELVALKVSHIHGEAGYCQVVQGKGQKDRQVPVPDTVLRYLARYTHRTAISLSRIESVDSSSVRFRWKDYRDNRTKSMTLPGEEFLRRFLLHILPKGLMRIRHYGYLANRVREKQLKKIRDTLTPCDHREAALRESPSVPAERLQARCPKCKLGYLRFVGEIVPERQRRRYALIPSS